MRQIRIGKRRPDRPTGGKSRCWLTHDPTSSTSIKSPAAPELFLCPPSPARRARPGHADPRHPVTRHAVPWL